MATVQQQMQVTGSHAEYREELRRFLKVATAKRARLVVFPELGGLVVAPPLLGDFRSGLIKQAERRHMRRATLWERLQGGFASVLAQWLKADLRLGLAGLLDVAPSSIWSAYCETFGDLAREFGVTLVAPSGYFPDPRDGVVRSLAAVFDEQGELLGTQAKVVLHNEDQDLAQPGSTWDVIPTPVGRLGLMLGADVLFPEVGRVLAYQGADALVVQGACVEPVLYNKIRTGVLARMQDNQLFAAAAFLVGRNCLSRGMRAPYVGKSAIFAPQELTPRKSGVLVEMTSRQSEGVLTAVWDFAALRELWERSDTPVRRNLPLEQTGPILGQLYSRLEHLPRLLPADLVEGEIDADGDGATDLIQAASHATRAERPQLSLDELEVRSSITSRWPVDAGPEVTGMAEAGEDMSPLDTPDHADVASHAGASQLEDGVAWPDGELDPNLSAAPHNPSASADTFGEDETDEMDALSRRSSARSESADEDRTK